jgi:hypothetical protein
MLRRVALVRTNVSEELSASFIKVARIGELGTTRRNIPEDNILHVFICHVTHLYVIVLYYCDTLGIWHMRKVTRFVFGMNNGFIRYVITLAVAYNESQ